MRIFIVNDPAGVQKLSSLLRQTPHGTCITGAAQNGQASVQDILKTGADLVLMDWESSCEDGFAAAQNIWSTCGVPLVLTGCARDLDASCRCDGIWGYLPVSAGPRELDVVLRIALCRHAEFQQEREEHRHAVARLESRKLVERAKGILMDRFGLSEQEAYRALQRNSKNKNRPMDQIARDILQFAAI